MAQQRGIFFTLWHYHNESILLRRKYYEDIEAGRKTLKSCIVWMTSYECSYEWNYLSSVAIPVAYTNNWRRSDIFQEPFATPAKWRGKFDRVCRIVKLRHDFNVSATQGDKISPIATDSFQTETERKLKHRLLQRRKRTDSWNGPWDHKRWYVP